MRVDEKSAVNVLGHGGYSGGNRVFVVRYACHQQRSGDLMTVEFGLPVLREFSRIIRRHCPTGQRGDLRESIVSLRQRRRLADKRCEKTPREKVRVRVTDFEFAKGRELFHDGQ